MQKLEIFQSLWGMELRSPVRPERSADENFSMVAAAGFDGMCIDFGADEIRQFRQLKTHFKEYDLGCMVNAFPCKVGDLQPILDLANEFDACMTNVIGGVMPLTVDEIVPVIYQWMDEAEKAEMQLLFETHRDSTLNDLYFTLLLIQKVPEMRLCADLSHFVVDREFREPVPAVDQSYIERILERSDCFQGRVAGREQVQVQINFPQHQQWVEIFKGWWKQGMRQWRQRNDDDATLRFLCELGPPPYAMTDGDRLELSDRWDESLQIKGWVEDIWAQLEAEEQA